MMEFLPCCSNFLSSSNPLTGTMSAQTVLQMPSSALIWCLIIDCGQLVKSSSCFEGPPRPPVTRKYCRLHFSLHNKQTGESSSPAHVSALCVAVCTAGVSEVHTVTLGDSERLTEKQFCRSFPCEENELRKITARIALCNLLCLSLHPQFMRL